MSSWCKGYIDERIAYKSELNNVEVTYINPAYTSQICSECGMLGKRNFKVFICEKCGRKDADRNAAKNILKRKDMKNITVYTSVKNVKNILGIV